MATIHNPDQYMAGLRQVIAQGRKRIGFLVGAGAPASIKIAGSNAPLIPAVAGLTSVVLAALQQDFSAPLASLLAELDNPNIETLLTRTRGLSAVIGSTKVHGLDAAGFAKLSSAICKEIGGVVNQQLPDSPNAFSELVSWIGGTSRAHAVEIFTTNYDLLFEEAFERARIGYFDGFVGANKPFFDPPTVSSNDLPTRWTRLWKLHGSLGWTNNARGEVIRSGLREAHHLIFPEHLKYDQTQKAPYSALFDRLRDFMMHDDVLLIATGFSFADAHISARVDECLAANPSAATYAFQFGNLDTSSPSYSIAHRRSNFSLFGRQSAVINTIEGNWKPGDPPTKDWLAIRNTYWAPTGGGEFLLGGFDKLCRFFAEAKGTLEVPVTTTAGAP